MQRYLDLTNDLAFKKVFSYKSTLIAFLNTILDLKGELTIVDLNYISQEEVPISFEEKKRAIMDVRCTTEDGTIFIVEMQNLASQAFLKRAQFYAACTYANQLSKSEDHIALKSVVLLSIMGETIFDDNPAYISYHKTVNVNTGVSYLQDMSYVFVELPKFKKTKEECIDLQDQWIYTLQNAEEEADIPFADHTLHDVYEQLEKSRWTADEFQDYLWLKLRTDEAAIKLKDEFEAGEAKGKEEGKAETAQNIARAMKKMEIAVDKIAEATGLTTEEIDVL